MNKYLLQALRVFLLLVSLLPHLNFAQVEITLLQSREMFILEAIKNEQIAVTKVNTSGRNQGFGRFQSTNPIVPFDSGLVLSTGNVTDIQSNNISPSRTGVHRTAGNHFFLYPIAKQTTFDGVTIEIQFIPKKEIITFNYVFGSEEYPEYVGSPFNDVFAFHLFLDGIVEERINLATLPSNGAPITVNSINFNKNAEFYVGNHAQFNDSAETYPIEFDGMTKPLMAIARVIPGEKYTLVISLADATDNAYDSGVFIEFGSFKSVEVEEIREAYTAYLGKFDQVKASQGKIANTLDLDEAKSIENQNIETKTPALETVTDSLVVLFAFDEYSLSDSAKKELTSFVNKYPSSEFQIVAHTDNKGSLNYNQSLSEKRGNSVSQWMVSQGERSTFSWKAYLQPAQNNATSIGRINNRRAVIYSRK